MHQISNFDLVTYLNFKNTIICVKRDLISYNHFSFGNFITNEMGYYPNKKNIVNINFFN